MINISIISWTNRVCSHYLRIIGKVKKALVAHAYNPSYSGSKDQEDHHWRPAGKSSSVRLNLKKGLVEWLKV
jgi:hypothetical protein